MGEESGDEEGYEGHEGDESHEEESHEEKGYESQQDRQGQACEIFGLPRNQREDAERPGEIGYDEEQVRQDRDACKKARKELGIKGFCPVGGKTAQGKALYAKVKS